MRVLRPEEPKDIEAIERINAAAFPSDAEAKLVAALRRSDAFIPELSWVAEEEGTPVGHLLLTRVRIRNGEHSVPALALAPMAVLPAHQRRGIGSALVNASLERAQKLGERLVIVLGHPAFYPRFGFTPARPRGLSIPWDAPSEAFLVRELQPGALEGVSGRVEYAAPFLDL